MRKFVLGAAMVLLMLGNAAYGHAETVTLKLTGVGGANDGHFYVYPYNFSVNGVGSVPLICDDFTDEVYFGESWTANVYGFADIVSGKGQMGSVLPLETNRVKAYTDAAWLYKQLNSSNAVAINHTIWALFANTSPYFTITTSDYWYGQAEAATSTSGFNAATEFSNIVFYTPKTDPHDWPDADGRPQEYIGTGVPPTSTPESSTAILMGGGLLGLFISRKKLMGMTQAG
jgi:hypothetical protein